MEPPETTETTETTESLENPPREPKVAYVYMLECADGTLYTGWTFNPENRLKQHNAGRGAKYTRARRPVKMVYLEKVTNENLARQREYALKQLTREQKQKIIRAQSLQTPGQS